MTTRLEGKTAVITGGATGIGFAASKRFIEEGAFVYIFGRTASALGAAMAKLGPNARGVTGSINETEDLDRLFEVVKEERGGIDILLANAGISEPTPLGQTTTEQFDRVFGTNVKGLLFTVQGALPLMGKGGSIILTGSSATVKGFSNFSLYAATKAAVRSFARSWTLELADRGIRVNVLSPGLTETEKVLELMGKDGIEAVRGITPIGRIADPDEIGAVAAFLASSDSGFMAGAEVFADGGIAQV
ncbi:SDR family oxidoreductase [Mycobacterium sp. KBS0706]|uniref:SDR family NAD(P)-dependent oxidoreductase n=1 Tax=Mycobacterium sp. KBS0706 TaxID=2578109 RepID=UPI00110F85EB|nr:SDR family oxidoreductase [Mycobacterium sp. KBS0706]TSD83131.1 SDR family oxidoreductase [Mycobacterium sp. KBS0706]